MFTSFIEAFKIVGYSIFIPLVFFLAISAICLLILRKTDPEKSRRLLLRMDFLVLLSFFLSIFIFVYHIWREWIIRDIIGDEGIAAIAGIGAAFLLTGLIYLALMIGVFTLMIEKFSPSLFEVPLYAGYREILKRHFNNYFMLIFYVSFVFLSSYLIGYYFDNPDITIYIYTLIYLLYNLFTPVITNFFNKSKELKDGQVFDEYMDLLEKTLIHPRKIRITESCYGVANALVVGVLPGFTEILLFKPLVENLNIQEIKAIIAHELAHIKQKHALIRAVSMLIFVFILGQTYLATNGSMFTIPIIITFAIIYSLIIRNQEQNADIFAAELTSPEELVSALKKIDILNRKASGELVEKTFFEMTGRRSPMDLRCEYIMQRFGKDLEIHSNEETMPT